MSTINFINQVGFDANGTAKMISFSYNTTNPTSGELVANTISIPFLTIVPIPFIRVSDGVTPAQRWRYLAHLLEQ